MKSLTLLGLASLMVAGATTAFAQGAAAPAAAGGAPMVELKVGDKAPNFKLQGTDGKTHNLVGLRRQEGGRRRVVPRGVHPGLHRRVQVARRARRHDQEVPGAVLHGQRGSDREEHRVCEGDIGDAGARK